MPYLPPIGKLGGALLSPKDIIAHTKDPQLVMNVVL